MKIWNVLRDTFESYLFRSNRQGYYQTYKFLISAFIRQSVTWLFNTSVTRFGEISPLWQNFKSLWLFLRVYFVLGKILNPTGHIFRILGKFSLFLLAQYWRNNLAIWSHWSTTMLMLMITFPRRSAARCFSV